MVKDERELASGLHIGLLPQKWIIPKKGWLFWPCRLAGQFCATSRTWLLKKCSHEKSKFIGNVSWTQTRLNPSFWLILAILIIIYVFIKVSWLFWAYRLTGPPPQKWTPPQKNLFQNVFQSILSKKNSYFSYKFFFGNFKNFRKIL